MAVVIGSEDRIPIDVPFKVSAGPGAGKTHWLIGHIRDVIAHSNKLGAVKKVACITYTNVGTDTISHRLHYDNNCVEVATIHSFLFANVVKPYAYLVAEEIGLKTEGLIVVDESNYMSQGLAYELLSDMGKLWIDAELFSLALRRCRWHYDNHQFVGFKPKYAQPAQKRKKTYKIPNDAYVYFKNYLWSQGELSYDDILYVSWLIFGKYPQAYKLLQARYPYFFVDEFQDTIPFVVDFLQRMGNEGTIVGVVGDEAQAIYEFVGATARQFDNFTVPGMQEYEIHGNRRSTQQIVTLLNAIRTDFQQDHLSGLTGEVPVLVVGDMLNCYQWSLERSGTDDVRSLAFPNIIANSMRTRNGARTAVNILDDDFDSDATRQYVVKALLKAVEYARISDLRNAWHQLDMIDDDRTKTIVLLRRLLTCYDEFKDGSLMDFFSFVNSQLGLGLKGFRRGDAKTYYETHQYRDAALGVKGADADTKHKTIHKSKGDEFDNVFVVLNEEKDLAFMLAPQLDDEVAHRVYYVGISRAIQRLYVNTPTLSAENELAIAALPIRVERV